MNTLADLARQLPSAWAQLASRGQWRPARHLDLIEDAVLTAMVNGDRLVITAPPRHGKSQICGRYVPSWFLGRNPDKRVVVASHAATLATKHGRQARGDFEACGAEVFGLRVDPRSHAAERWDIEGRAGGFQAVGIGTMLTGFGADLLVVDDYCPDAEAALSQVQRDGVWDWWESVAAPRLEPGATAIVFATRWHDDDLIGRLLSREPGRWQVVRLPALAETDDPLGRAPGEALWPERFDRETLEQIRESRSAFWWSAMYQGRPVPEGGGILKPEWWRETRYLLEGDRLRCEDGTTLLVSDLLRFVVVDTALTISKTSDYSVIAACGLAPNGRLFVLDVVRQRMDSLEVPPAVLSSVRRWGAVSAWVERSSASITQLALMRRIGVPVREFGKAGDVSLLLPSGGGSDPKVPTYHAAAAFIGSKRLWLPRAASWLPDVEAELSSVPFSVTGHDDAAETMCVACLVADRMGGTQSLVSAYRIPTMDLPPDPRTGVVQRMPYDNHSPAPW